MEASKRAWDVNMGVWRQARGPRRPACRSGRKQEGFGGQPEAMEARKRAWKASLRVWRTAEREDICFRTEDGFWLRMKMKIKM